MAPPTPPPSDAAVAAELAQIAERLAALASCEDAPSVIGKELVSIRAHLRRLAEENAEVRARLGASLGLEPPAQ